MASLVGKTTWGGYTYGSGTTAPSGSTSSGSSSGGSSGGSSSGTVTNTNQVETRSDGIVITRRTDGSVTVKFPDGRTFRLGDDSDLNDFISDYKADPAAAVAERDGSGGAEEVPIVPLPTGGGPDRDYLRSLLDQFNLATPGLINLIEQAVRNDWSVDKFLVEMRKSADYLANPLFAANIARSREEGMRFLSEGEILNYKTEANRLARQFGYGDISDNYLAQGIATGKSLAEIEHILQVQQRVKEMGGGVAMVYREVYGHDPTDQDLFDIFDPEKDTQDVDDALRQALYRGRPLTLGLGIRTAAEARAFEMLGVDVNEAWTRYEGLAANSDRFARLGAIEDLITKDLPADFGANLSTEENSTLVRALLFNDQQALAQLQNVMAREVARFNTGSGVARSGLAAVGLLEADER